MYFYNRIQQHMCTYVRSTHGAFMFAFQFQARVTRWVCEKKIAQNVAQLIDCPKYCLHM
jgi:hypothetical protein